MGALRLWEVLLRPLPGTPGVGRLTQSTRVACWFWNKHSLSTLADDVLLDASSRHFLGPHFDRITKAINGGYSGKEDRDARYLRALKVLGA